MKTSRVRKRKVMKNLQSDIRVIQKLLKNKKELRKISVSFGSIESSNIEKREGIRVFGEVTGNHIRINLLVRTHPARTFLHELIHWRFPNMKAHDRVRRIEKIVWDQLNNRDLFCLYKILFNRRQYTITEEY